MGLLNASLQRFPDIWRDLVLELQLLSIDLENQRIFSWSASSSGTAMSATHLPRSIRIKYRKIRIRSLLYHTFLAQ